MKRVVFVTVLSVLCIEAIILIPLLSLTPTGTRVLTVLHPPPSPTPTPDPVLTVQGTPPPIESTAVYLLDADTGHVLVNINSQKRLPMASTTKIMTALIAIQRENLDQIVTVHQDAIDEVKKNDGSSAQLIVDDQIRLGDLLYGLMLPSGDDAAIAIADAISGSAAGFVKLMNSYAHQLHLVHTYYSNPDGLTYELPSSPGIPDSHEQSTDKSSKSQANSSDHTRVSGKPPKSQAASNGYTTAADLAQLTRIALRYPLFAQIVELQRYVLPASPTHHAYTWETTDNLLSHYAGVTGVKTGYTVEAGYCLVFAATDAGHHLIGVLLHDSDDDTNQRFVDAQALLDWGFHLPLRAPS